MALCEFCERSLEQSLAKGEACPHCGFEATGTNSGIIPSSTPVVTNTLASPPPVEDEDDEEEEFSLKDVLRTISGRGPKEDPRRSHTVFLDNGPGFISSESIPQQPGSVPLAINPAPSGPVAAPSTPPPIASSTAMESTPTEKPDSLDNEPPRELPPPTRPREKSPDESTVRTLDLPMSGSMSVPVPGQSNTPSAAWSAAISSSPSGPTAEKMAAAWGKSLTAPITPLSTIKASNPEGDDEVSNLLLRTYRVQMPGEATYERAEYLVKDVIGEGGVGIVYAATQASVSRTVALKMLRDEYARRSDHRNKFLTEAVVTGELDHPNIVPIYDLGTTSDGTLFYAMKRVRGTPWSQVIRDKTLAENLKILMSVADAIAFAHDRQVVHRDLKPENVMLGDFGEVLVMDWGIALSTSMYIEGAGRISQTSSMGGTPAYMAPEMATGPIELIGPPSDIYLLGAILFEIISGRPPHNGKDVMSCLFAAARNEIQETDKTGELLDIAMLAMSTDIKARHASVKELQNAIQQYLSHSESIVLSTRADMELSTASRTRDYQDYARALFAFQESKELWPGNSRATTGELEARIAYAQCALDKSDYDLGVSLLDPRDPAQLPLYRKLQSAQSERSLRQQRLNGLRRIAVLLVLFVLVVVTSAFFWIRNQAAVVAKTNESLKTLNSELDSQKTTLETQKGELETNRTVLESQKDELEANQSRLQLEIDRADTEAKLARESQQREALASYLAQIGVSAERVANNSFLDADRLLAQYEQSDTSYFRHWEWSHLRYLCGLDVATLESNGRVECLARSDSGNLLAACSSAGVIKVWSADWNLQKFTELQSIETGDNIAGISLSRDGLLLAAAIDSPRGIVKIYRRDSKSNFALEKDLTIHRSGVLSVEISPNGQELVTSSRDETARITDLATGEQLFAFRGHFGPVWSARFDSAGEQVVTAGDDATVRLWSRAKSQKPRVFRGHKEAAYAATFSGDGQLIASGGRDKEILVWKPSDLRVFDYKLVEQQLELERLGRPLPVNPLGDIAVQRLMGHSAEVRTLAFSRDSQKLLSGGHDNTARVWNLTAKPDDPNFVQVLRGHGGWVRSCLYSPDEKYALSGSHDQRVKVWNAPEYEEVRTLRLHDNAVLWASFSSQGDRCITAGRDRRAILWNLDTGKPVVQLSNDPLEQAELASAAKGGAAAELKEGHEFLVTSALFMPAGDRRLITSAGDNTVRLWDIASGGQLHRFDGTGTISVIALSDDGKWLVTGSDTKDALLWSLADLSQPPVRLTAHKFEVSTAAFSHDSETGDLRICTGDSGGVCHLWRREGASGQWKTYSRIATHEPGYGITCVAFTPDGRRLLTASQDHTVMQWDLVSGDRLGQLTLRHPDGVKSMVLSADGQRAITMCSTGDETYRLYNWDISTASSQECELQIPGHTATGISLRPDQRTALITTTTGDVSSLWVWDLQSPQVQPLWATKSLRGTVWSAISSQDGASILAVGGSQARLLSTETGELEKTFSPHGAITAANFSTNGQLAVTASSDGDAKIWCTDEQSDKFGLVLLKMSRLHEIGGRAFAVNFASFAPNTSGDPLLLTCGDDSLVKMWMIKLEGPAPSYELVGMFEGHRARIHSAVFSPDGEMIVTASADRTARVWNVSTMVPIAGGILEHPADVLFATFSPDNSRIITGCDDNLARVWKFDGSSGVQLTDTLSGHTAAVTSVAISGDNRRAVTGSKDGIAKLWCLETGKEVLSLKRHEAEITSVHFSRNGRDILTSSHDETALVWRSVNIAPSVRIVSSIEAGKPGMLQTLDHLAEVRDPDSPELGGGMLSVELMDVEQSGEISLVLAPSVKSGLVVDGNSILLHSEHGGSVKVAEFESGPLGSAPRGETIGQPASDDLLALEGPAGNEDQPEGEPADRSTAGAGEQLIFTFTSDATVEVAEKILRSIALQIGQKYAGQRAEVRVILTDNLKAASNPAIIVIQPKDAGGELTATRELHTTW